VTVRFATLAMAGREVACALHPERGWLALDSIAEVPPGSDALGVIRAGLTDDLRERIIDDLEGAPDDAFVAAGDACMLAPSRHPRFILGIGLNYLAHARDLDAAHPDEPASFIKGDHTVIGPGERIVLPPQSLRVTAEAELGLVIGRRAWQVGVDEALDHVAAVVCVLDQTAEDVLQRNPRFLTRAKNFPTFLSLGAELVTLDEVRATDGPDGLDHLEVATWRNGELHRADVVAGMAFGPAELVAFHSRIMPLEPGDLILTGTPGAVVVDDGDVVECRISGVGRLANPVVRPT
jgi:2-keto-4-pentenoate hydratase/2-oxohepta-3-ene-1,7-dioic acid hydratase in catechol pathway